MSERATFRFEPLFRTPNSEQWSAIHEGDPAPVGRVDVHFDGGSARVTLVARDDVTDEAAQELLALVDERLVPERARRDVRITLWRGQHNGTFVPE